MWCLLVTETVDMSTFFLVEKPHIVFAYWCNYVPTCPRVIRTSCVDPLAISRVAGCELTSELLPERLTTLERMRCLGLGPTVGGRLRQTNDMPRDTFAKAFIEPSQFCIGFLCC